MVVEEAQSSLEGIVDQGGGDSPDDDTPNDTCDLHAIEYQQSETVFFFKFNAHALEFVPTTLSKSANGENNIATFGG